MVEFESSADGHSDIEHHLIGIAKSMDEIGVKANMVGHYTVITRKEFNESNDGGKLSWLDKHGGL